MTIGEVRWVEMPVRGGRAQAGRRPAIVMQSAVGLPTTLIIPLTSQLDALRFAGTVLVEATSQNGLRRASIALVFQLTAVDGRHISERLGAVSKEVMGELWLALDKLTGRP
ncbi:MAG TPA: type II toxin-antitoxin system PemK/MazF family toxin [Pyrinomonadaceae bacterium]